jgi:hypothetical protein
MEQCFYGGFDGAIHSDLDMGDLDTGISVDLAMEASDGIILTTATITMVVRI